MYRAINWNTNQVLAVKQIQLEGSTEDEIVQHMLEVELVKRLSHPNIIKYSGVVRDKNTLSIALECVLHDPVHPSLALARLFLCLTSDLASGVGIFKTGPSSKCSKRLAR